LLKTSTNKAKKVKKIPPFSFVGAAGKEFGKASGGYMAGFLLEVITCSQRTANGC
jgi:hypothetical protein